MKKPVWPSNLIIALMAFAAITFALASTIHFGVTTPLGFVTIYDPFAGAAIPEAVIAVVLVAGLVAVIAHWSIRWGFALGTTLFAFIGTLYGLSVTLRSTRTGDIVYHISVLIVLVAILLMLLLPVGKRSLSGRN